MKVIVFGGTGFIGHRFVDLYRDDFDEMVSLGSQDAPLGDYQTILRATLGADVVVHSAFDHNYRHNISGILNILRACRINGVPKLVYLSTVSVYSLDSEPEITEASVYTTSNDHYSREKKKIEKVIASHETSELSIVILQPTIVYGLGGNWTSFALGACKSQTVCLPDGGRGRCEAVYVDDVARAMFLSCRKSLEKEKLLISSGEAITWEQFYQGHRSTLQNLELPEGLSIKNSKSTHRFHPNGAINLIFFLCFKTPIGFIFHPLTRTLKNLRAKRKGRPAKGGNLRQFLQSNPDKKTLSPMGATWKVHKGLPRVNIAKAKKTLGFSPSFPFDLGIKMVEGDIKKGLTS